MYSARSLRKMTTSSATFAGRLLMSRSLLVVAVVLGALVAACEGCKATKPGKTQDIARSDVATGRLVLMSDLGAALEPCGCVADQRGGLARLGAFTEGVPFPVAVAAAGPTFFDDAVLDGPLAEQRREKARTVASVLSRGPFVFAPSRSDFAGGSALLSELLSASKARPVSSSVLVNDKPFGESVLLDIGPTKVAFVGFSGAPKNTLLPEVPGVVFARDGAVLAGEVERVRAQGARFVVLLASGSRGEALRIVDRAPGIDLVLVGTDAVRGEVVREDVPVDRIEKTVILEPASRLQSVAVLELFDRGGAFVEGDASGEGSRFQARLELVGPSRAKSAGISSVLTSYDQRVDVQNRVRFADRTPAPAAAGEAHYVGVEVCGNCHSQPLAVWKGHRHSGAYASLTEKHKAFDLDCVGCHVTGYEKPGGSTVTHVDKLENVQCEVCHGPGSKHVEGGGLKSAITRKPEPALCTGCHHEPHVEKTWRVEDAWPKILGKGHGLGPG
jgi:hypothetical protein